MKVSTVEMTHEEWLQDRRKGLGGSDIATVMGLNKYKSIYQLWIEKTGQAELEHTESEPAYWGNVLEEVVAKEFQERTGFKVRRRNEVFEHSQYPFLRANIDRDIVGERAFLECKTANTYLSKEWEGEEIPIQYLCQVQHYMNVLDYDYCYIAVLIGGQKFVYKKIERDQEVINIIQNASIKFWNCNVLKKIEPVIDGSEATNEYLRSKYKDINSREVSLPESFNELITQLREIKDSEKQLKESRRQVENEIISELGKRDAEIGITSRNILSFKETSRKTFDKKLMKEKYPDVASDEELWKLSKSRVLREKEIK